MRSVVVEDGLGSAIEIEHHAGRIQSLRMFETCVATLICTGKVPDLERISWFLFCKEELLASTLIAWMSQLSSPFPKPGNWASEILSVLKSANEVAPLSQDNVFV